MKSLAALAAERETLVKDLARTQELLPKTQEKIEKLLESGDLDDPKLAAKLGEHRTKIELIPTKCRQLEAAIVKVDADVLKPAIFGAVRKFNAVARDERAALLAQIHSALRAFIPDVRSDAPIINEVYGLAPAYYGRISELEVSCSRFDRHDSDAGESAAFLLNLATKHGIDLDKLPEVPPYVPPVAESATSTGRDYVPRKRTRQELRDLEEAEARQSQAEAAEVVEAGQS